MRKWEAGRVQAVYKTSAGVLSRLKRSFKGGTGITGGQMQTQRYGRGSSDVQYHDWTAVTEDMQTTQREQQPLKGFAASVTPVWPATRG